MEEKMVAGQGRKTFTTDRQSSTATKLVNDWLRLDKDASAYWHKQAKDQLETARWSREVKEEKKSVEWIATRQLVLQMHQEFRREVPKTADGVYKDLPHQMLSDVNTLMAVMRHPLEGHSRRRNGLPLRVDDRKRIAIDDSKRQPIAAVGFRPESW